MGIATTIRTLLRKRVPSNDPHRAPRRRKRVNANSSSDEFLKATWRNLREEYFPDRGDLDLYAVTWSPRKQRRVLASCNISRKRVLVARELFQPSACRWIQAVLYHELCHAALGTDIIDSSGTRRWHGPRFRELEARHPDIRAMYAWIRSGGWAMTVLTYQAP